jgi:hypothetical protein
MKGKPISKVAKGLNMTPSSLLSQLKTMGVEVDNVNDLIDGDLQLKMLRNVGNSEPSSEINVSPTIEDIKSSTDLSDINELFTKLMAQRKMQTFFKDENLEVIIKRIHELRTISEKHGKIEAASIFGRLSALARNKEAKARFLEEVENIFEVDEIPESLEKLQDADSKYYAALGMRTIGAPWLPFYCVREALSIENAPNAQRALLKMALELVGNLCELCLLFEITKEIFADEPKPDNRLRRLSRVAIALDEVVQLWTGDIGENPSYSLERWVKYSFGYISANTDEEAAFAIVDSSINLLIRTIQLRFSNALDADIFNFLVSAKRILGGPLWSDFVRKSESIDDLRLILMESALVLARQNRTNKKYVDLLCSIYSSRIQVKSALKNHFLEAKDLDPDIHAWWINAGSISEQKALKEQPMGNSEDQLIGGLLIEIEENTEVMSKLGRAVVPFLEISDPPLAATVSHAEKSFLKMSEIGKMLARIRKLSNTDIKGKTVDYNMLEHDMLGGHQAGISKVRVVKEGIRKNYGGRIKTLVKPWVEPEE